MSGQCGLKMPATQGYIAIIATNLGLLARGHRLALPVNTQVHRRLAATGAHRFQLGQRIGNRQQPLAARTQIAQKIGTQALAEHGNAQIIGDMRQLPDLVLGQELGFIDQHAIERAHRMRAGHGSKQIGFGSKHVGRR